MTLKVVGPLLFATMLFIVSSAIKAVSFQSFNFYLDMPQEFALWGVGIVFSLAVTEHTHFGVKTVHTITRKKTQTGYEIDYGIVLPEQYHFTPKYIYLFVFSMMLWILTLVLCGRGSIWITDPKMQFEAISAISASFVFAGTNVGISFRSLMETVL